MTKLRQTIARRLKDAQNTAAMLTTFNDVDMSGVMGLRAHYKEAFEKKHGVKLGFMGFFVKACIQALKEIPAVNAEIDGDELVYKNYYHIGVAVGTEKGLVVPVVKKRRPDDGRRYREVDFRIRQARARRPSRHRGHAGRHLHDLERRRLRLADVDADFERAAVRHSRHAPIEERPIALKGQVVIRPMMYLALSYDHRVVDGQQAVTFLVRVKENLEDPARLVLDL